MDTHNPITTNYHPIFLVGWWLLDGSINHMFLNGDGSRAPIMRAAGSTLEQHIGVIKGEHLRGHQRKLHWFHSQNYGFPVFHSLNQVRMLCLLFVSFYRRQPGTDRFNPQFQAGAGMCLSCSSKAMGPWAQQEHNVFSWIWVCDHCPTITGFMVHTPTKQSTLPCLV